MAQTTENGLSLNVRMEGYNRLDFDKRQIRAVLMREGRAIQKAARKMVARRAISGPGELPGRMTGELMRSIKIKKGSAGYWVKIYPTKTAEMKAAYPWMLVAGVKTGAADKKIRTNAHVVAYAYRFFLGVGQHA